jgi:Ca2+-binding RTX toxin-like protein
MRRHRFVPRGLVGGIGLALAGAGAGLALPAGGQTLQGETCEGRPATIVGPGVAGELFGTDGPDVMVSNGAVAVSGEAGDDFICVTGGSHLSHVSVFAGDGADVVTMTASDAATAEVNLGFGDDSFVGGDAPEYVTAGSPGTIPVSQAGQGADTVTTGGGQDTVLTGGTLANPDHDDIDLGSGNDRAWMRGPADPALPVQAGPGWDQLRFDGTVLPDLVIDNAAGRATDDGAPVMTWSGMERFALYGSFSGSDAEPPSFIGGAGSERVWTQVPFAAADLGDGDDRLELRLRGQLPDHASYVGGLGDDYLFLTGSLYDESARRIEADLPGGRLLFSKDQQVVHARVASFEQYRFTALRVDVLGTPISDHVEWWGCHGLVAGGAGDDYLDTAVSIGDAHDCGRKGKDVDLVVRGGAGDDTLLGAFSPDTLLGGPGTDYAHGFRNRDRCRAETMVSCEQAAH